MGSKTAHQRTGARRAFVHATALRPRSFVPLITALLVAVALSGCAHEGGGKSSQDGPVASFTHSCTGYTCSFDASHTSPGDAAITDYTWDLGDSGPTRTGKTIDHSFTETGSFEVTLTVRDDAGLEHASIRIVELVEIGPTAVARHSCDGTSCSFDASDSTPGTALIREYEWVLRPGTPPKDGMTVDHTYAEAGTYEVTLTVVDREGASDKDVLQVTIAGTTPENEECNEPGAPGEQEKGSTDDIECPGDFAVIEEGSEPTWEVPTWEVGHWWEYEIRQKGFDAMCLMVGYEDPDYLNPRMTVSVEAVDTVSGSDWEVPVYEMALDLVACNEDDPNSETDHVTYTQAHLSQIEESGLISHQMRFPMSDGQSWVFQQENGYPSTVEVEHAGLYETYQDTWRVVEVAENGGFEDEPTEETSTSYYDEEVEWLVYGEMTEGDETLVIDLVEWHGA